MSINPSQIGSQAITQNYDTAIELLVTRPTPGAYLQTPVTPNSLVGYYDPQNDQVELYVVDNTGYRYLKIV